MLDFLPKIPLGDYFEDFIDFLDTYLGWFFEGVSNVIRGTVSGFESVLYFVPALIMIIGFTALAYWLGKRSLALFTFFGLLVIELVDLWESAMSSLALVLVSSLIALLIGIPIGIYAARSERANKIVRPVLDFMQTMPAFVYLIPAIILFERGNVAGTIATVIFAMPPVVRLANLGIRQVPEDVMEAAKSLGSTKRQLLFKIQLPMALPTILAGINQTIMLALSMVVIASMIGAGGLGSDVRAALSRVDIGYGFEAGIAVVMLAMIIDRISQAIGNKTNQY
jgi:glycine betaine/proline transport system permease protein